MHKCTNQNQLCIYITMQHVVFKRHVPNRHVPKHLAGAQKHSFRVDRVPSRLLNEVVSGFFHLLVMCTVRFGVWWWSKVRCGFLE